MLSLGLTQIHLVRHGQTEDTGLRLSGRNQSVGLNEIGKAEASQAARRLRAGTPILTSPIARARETASILATSLRSSLDVSDCLQEFDFGEWTGQTFDHLQMDKRWRAFNESRSTAPTPAGETMRDVALRAIAGLRRITQESVIVVSHMDVIRAVLIEILGIPFDDFSRLTIGTASISEIQIDGSSTSVVRINDRAHLE